MTTRDKLLFTPGPLTTSATVKEAMLADLGSRDASFISIVREIRGVVADHRAWDTHDDVTIDVRIATGEAFHHHRIATQRRNE